MGQMIEQEDEMQDLSVDKGDIAQELETEGQLDATEQTEKLRGKRHPYSKAHHEHNSIYTSQQISRSQADISTQKTQQAEHVMPFPGFVKTNNFVH